MIHHTDPRSPVGEANTVLVYSDAKSNEEAVQEVDEWAGANGFLRTREYSLNVVRQGDRRYRVGICYRLRGEDRIETEEAVTRAKKRREDMPQTAKSADLRSD